MIIWTSVQIIIGLHEQKARLRKQAQLEFSIPVETENMMKSLDKETFLDLVESQYVMENVRFLQDLKTFKDYYYEKSPSWRKSKIKILYDAYIVEGAIMEINISYACREAIKQVVFTREESTVFDEAEKQVQGMLVNGVWKDYLTLERTKDNNKKLVLVGEE